VRPWIDHLGFLVIKAVGEKKSAAFLFFEESVIECVQPVLHQISALPPYMSGAAYG
jgi:hypothetical protein